MNEQLKQEIIIALDIAYRFKESDIIYKSYLSAIYEQLIITEVSNRTWSANEIVNQLYEFESIDEAKRWFSEYGY